MNRSRSSSLRFLCLLIPIALSALGALRAEEVGERWGTEEREREYYPIVSIPLRRLRPR